MSTSPAPTRFSRPRFALLVMLGVYPLITGLLYIVVPLTESWATWQRTLVIVPLMVITIIWGLIPGVQKLFSGFINPASRGASIRQDSR
jgi:antibiotic biosynthesis monooxygenase (ABM) superfamily enzyme